MDTYKIKITDWCSTFEDYHIPRWEELPDIDLYMDQVVTFIERHVSLFSINENEKVITPAMINNYVKLKMIPAPTKKKYTKVHLAFLIAISILKQVLTINEIKNGIIFQGRLNGDKCAYNLFCQEQEDAFKLICGKVTNNNISGEENNLFGFDDIAVKMATLAFASKVFAQKAIQFQSDITNND